MDVTKWSTEEMRSWGDQDEHARVRDVQREYKAAKSIKSSMFNKAEWQAAAKNFTRLTLIDAQVRATRAADAVEQAIADGRVYGETPKRASRNEGRRVL